MAVFQIKAPSSQETATAGIHAVAYTTGGSPASTSIAAYITQVRLTANSDCHYAIGESGTSAGGATSSNAFLYRGVDRFLTVRGGEVFTAIASPTNGLTSATPGTLWVVEVS